MAACAVGANAAVILQSLYYWVTKNEANGKSFYDGRHWTYNSVSAFCGLFPYLSKGQINGALARLERDGYIVTGNYNKLKYDRTKWYALTEKGYALMENSKSISKNQEMDSEVSENGLSENEKPIPVSDTVTNPNTDKDRKRQRKRFTPPTRQECIDYAREKHPSVDGGRFWDYYAEGDWHDSRGNPVRNWKLKMNTWDNGGNQSSHRNPKVEKESELVRLPYGMMPESLVKTEEEIERMTQFQRDCYYHNARTYQRDWEAEHGNE